MTGILNDLFAPCKLIRIAESKKKLLVESEIQNIRVFACKIWNPTFWNPETGSKNPESWKTYLLESEIHRGGILNPVLI